MKLVPTSQLSLKQLENFFEDKWDDFKGKKVLLEYGYLVEHEGKYQAFFSLTPVLEASYWLKSLYMKEGVPATFTMAIIEAALELSRKNGADKIYVYSHMPALDALLTFLQFNQQKAPAFAEDSMLEEGTWFTMEVRKKQQVN